MHSTKVPWICCSFVKWGVNTLHGGKDRMTKKREIKREEDKQARKKESLREGKKWSLMGGLRRVFSASHIDNTPVECSCTSQC